MAFPHDGSLPVAYGRFTVDFSAVETFNGSHAQKKDGGPEFRTAVWACAALLQNYLAKPANSPSRTFASCEV